MLKRLLSHPFTRDMDVDDPRTTERRREIIRQNRFLHRIYLEWYSSIASALPAVSGGVLEIGSGAGFMSEVIPGLITSDVLPLPGVALVLDGHHLPFEDGSLRAIVMTNVLHHMPHVQEFFAEAARCLTDGGAIIMIEPWNTPWTRFVYGRVHSEPFCPAHPAWGFPESGPLSGANGALPWILFHRDRSRFEQEFPHLRIHHIRLLMPFRYLASGGVGSRRLAPNWTWHLWRGLERTLSSCMQFVAMFAQIHLVKTGGPS
jgi:SAM-dependent methyltransferase